MATLSRSYPDASFDFAISEYGACLWADPQRWVPEAARLLRPGGQLVFLMNSFLMMLCMPPEHDVAHRSVAAPRLRHLSNRMADRPGRRVPSVARRLDSSAPMLGFEIEDLIEVRPLQGATTNYPFVTLQWARKWPCEEVWKVRKRR